jgi:hypothetical protein
MTNSETFTELLQAIESRQKLIWLGLTASSTVYVPLAFVDVTMTAGRELVQNLGWAFYALAGVLAVASVVIRKYFLSARWLKAQWHQQVSPRQLATADTETGQMDGDKLAKLERLNETEIKLLGLAQANLVPLLLSLGLNDLIAVTGLVFVLCGASKVALIPFVGTAIILNIGMYPRLDAIIERAEAWVYTS